MASTSSQAFTYITSSRDLESFYQNHKNAEWLGFDTEFVGEKRFFTRLCLIQLTSTNGNFLIDPFEVDNLNPFLELLQNPDILKITHAGENDYRLLFHSYHITPRNVFDTQVAAGFIGYRYPLSFGKLVESELGIRLSKSYTVADWESRPLEGRQLKYALNDVLPLYDLWQNLSNKLNKQGRLSWAKEECQKLEHASYYEKNPHLEALNSSLIKAVNKKEKIFLIRLFEWRTNLAKEKDYSKEMVLPQKMIGHIVKSISSGIDALSQNRRISNKIIKNYGAIFENLYQKEVTTEELRLLKQIPVSEQEDPKAEILLEMLFLLIKYQCHEHGISPNLVAQRNNLKRLRKDPDALHEEFAEKWKRQILGEELIEWICNIDLLEIAFEDGKAILRMRT